MVKQKQSAPVSVYQMKVTLLDVRPLVWRRFHVTSNQTLYQLHLLLQTVMGWGNYHLYEFSLANAFLYGENDLVPEDTSGAKLYQLVRSEKQIFYYTYDFMISGIIGNMRLWWKGSSSRKKVLNIPYASKETAPVRQRTVEARQDMQTC